MWMRIRRSSSASRTPRSAGHKSCGDEAPQEESVDPARGAGQACCHRALCSEHFTANRRGPPRLAPDFGKRQGVPAFRIMTDKVLGAIARNRPRTAAELLAIPGIGIGAVEKYGAQIYRILNETGD